MVVKRWLFAVTPEHDNPAARGFGIDAKIVLIDKDGNVVIDDRYVTVESVEQYAATGDYAHVQDLKITIL